MRHLTIVYEIPDTMIDVSKLTSHELVSAMSWSHEIDLKNKAKNAIAAPTAQAEWTVNPDTLLFENLRPLQAQDLESLAYEGQVFGNTYFEHSAVVAFFDAMQIKSDTQLLVYSTVFLPRAALSASLCFKDLAYGI